MSDTHITPAPALAASPTPVAGITSVLFGVVSLVFLAPIFGPLAIVFSVFAFRRKQTVWAAIGLITAVIGLLTSPLMWMLLSGLALTSI